MQWAYMFKNKDLQKWYVLQQKLKGLSEEHYIDEATLM